MSEVAGRISQYLVAGGFFNPELMEHEKVRDLLVECRDEIIRLRERRRWIPVGKELPGHAVDVLVTADGWMRIAYWSGLEWRVMGQGKLETPRPPTHWMPLPWDEPLPKGVEVGE